jgi:TM2 domain-containing membrane protein YozV
MPARYAPVLFGFILSALMSFLVSGIATFRNAGLVDGFFLTWINAWAIAFPVVLVVAPITRKLVGVLVKAPAPAAR